MEKKISVLYFDDERWLSETLQKSLEYSYPNMNIRLVSTVEDLFDELNSENNYEIIVIDIMIPMTLILDNLKVKSKFSNMQIHNMNDGLNAGDIIYEEIRKIEKYKKIPILFYSAKRVSNVNEPETSFLRKPQFVEDIYEKINQMLNK